MPLKDFINTKQKTAPQPGGSLANFINKGSQPKAPIVKPEPIKKEVKKEDTSLFKFIGKQLMKPVGVASEVLETGSNVAGSLLIPFSSKFTAKQGIKKAGEEIVQGAKDIKDVITGKKETSFSDKLKEQRETINKITGYNPTKIENVANDVVGLGGDFVLDPLNKFKPVALAKKMDKIAGLSKIAKPVIKAVEDNKVFKATKSIFSNSTGNKAFDEVVSKFRNLYKYKEGELIDQAVNLQKEIKSLGKGSEEIITEGLENPNSLIGKDEKVIEIVKNLKSTYKDFLNKSKEVGLSVNEIAEYAPHIRTKSSLGEKVSNILGSKEWSKAGVEKGRKLQGTIKELSDQGIDIFEKNPAIQLAKKGQTYVKAITSKQFADEISKFAVKDGVEVSNSLLKGLKFAPEQAKVIDNYYKGIQPEELKAFIKGFDKVQNWWKAQALVAPSYHIRNIAGNLWNNFLAGVSPEAYITAAKMQKSNIPNKTIELAKKLNVIDDGWYASDIGEEVLSKVEGTKLTKSLNPLSQENILFKSNKAVGSAVENNAKLAHFISQLQKGLSPEEAAKSVKKYLFDYSDLTDAEKNIFKRAIPFYTWTRKNLPLQLSELIKQPAKYVLPHKIVEKIENSTEAPDEKYMSDYIKNNIPVRLRKNKDGNYEYFLLGQWLPYASAINVLSKPLDSLIGMVTPMIKTPYEIASNKSTFFKNSLGEPSPIETRYKQQGEFLGQSMRKKNITLLRNIRLLNDLNKWFDKQDKEDIKDSWTVKLMDTLFGKAATYDVLTSKMFYKRDTDDRVDEYLKAIKDAKRKGYKDKAKELQSELNQFQRERKLK